MTFLQKTSGVLMGVVFCFFVVQSTSAACVCNVAVEQDGRIAESCNSTNINYPFDLRIVIPSGGAWVFQLVEQYSEGTYPTVCTETAVVRDYLRNVKLFKKIHEICGQQDPSVCYEWIGDSVEMRTISTLGNEVRCIKDSDAGRSGSILHPCAAGVAATNNFCQDEFVRTNLFISTDSCGNSVSEHVDAFPRSQLSIRCQQTEDVVGAVTLTAAASISSCPVELDVITPPGSGPAYESIAFGFPTADIERLNKTGITGTGTTQVQLLIGRLIKYAVGFLGTLALCLVIYSGLKFMLSEGDADKQKEALNMMLWAGIGIVALLGSYSVVLFVLGILR